MAKNIESLIARVLKIDPRAIREDLQYQSIAEWDSLGHVSLMVALESEYQLTIDSEQVLELNSVRKIRDFVRRHQSLQAPEAKPPAPDVERQVPIHRGLNGVAVDRTEITFIDGENGRLLYRGYPVHELAVHATFEETCYLLLHGELPDRQSLKEFEAALRTARSLPSAAVNTIRAMAEAHPMDVLRTLVSVLAACDPERNDNSVEATLRKGMRLIAQVPSIVATHHAVRCGRCAPIPDDNLSHAANFLFQVQGQIPSEDAVRLMERDLIIHADHSSNASAFAARVVISTQADIHSAITAALSAFAGPLHGGAAENVMKMVHEIGQPENAADYVRERWARNEPIMGFGHRVYRVEDPRVRPLREAAMELSQKLGQPLWYRVLEAVALEMKRYARFGLHANVDFYSGVTYHLLGIPQDLFVPLFAVSRTAGWVAQALEQARNNILIRPLLHYVGHSERSYVSSRLDRASRREEGMR